MSKILSALHRQAYSRPTAPALDDGLRSLTYGQLANALRKANSTLAAYRPNTLGIFADNGVAWALADLAAWACEIPCVPLPLFFSPQQIAHAVRDGGIDGVLTDQPDILRAILLHAGLLCEPNGDIAGLHFMRIFGVPKATLHAGTAKITYTSGTTGNPKGVCLSHAHIEQVAEALRDAAKGDAQHRHLCLTPLSTLLENVGGLYAVILAGACCHLPGLRSVGLMGASALDARQMSHALRTSSANSAILVPQMLQALVAQLERETEGLPQLRFLAVGGAPVAPSILARAERLGLPVFEGYGLSECGSVVALNTADDWQRGAVGKPLPHLRLSFADDGEICVEGTVFLGYLGHPPISGPWPTGDLGYLDEAGFLHLRGRKKSVFITAFGRNVAPEWVESELTAHPAIAQAAVFGEAQAANCAVIVAPPERSDAELDATLQALNDTLPDYARVHHWLRADAAFTPQNGLATANGRLCREAILARYRERLDAFYANADHAVLR